MTPLKKGQWGTVCCVHAARAHSTQYPFTLFAGHSSIDLQAVIRVDLGLVDRVAQHALEQHVLYRRFALARFQCYNAPTMDRITFENLVDEALESLPPEIQGWLDNVAIVVGERPSPQQLARAGLRPNALLFGLYVGVPKTERGFTYGETVPDKIVIFRQPIERMCRTPEEIREQVRRTVLHEIGHHFGLDEGQLREAGV